MIDGLPTNADSMGLSELLFSMAAGRACETYKPYKTKEYQKIKKSLSDFIEALAIDFDTKDKLDSLSIELASIYGTQMYQYGFTDCIQFLLQAIAANKQAE